MAQISKIRRKLLPNAGWDIPNEFRVTVRRQGRSTDERRQLRDSASTRRQQSRNLKGEGYIR
ncbi:hypothetical protein [Candidatus Regiella insecticola]|uniref:hypothetical protein n=1 Tax=Candidatus Regiella insecticola TaxID=138073 RepID=UPI0015971728|nr:hypothetical protein [Candidatus Regiella insecticola]